MKAKLLIRVVLGTLAIAALLTWLQIFGSGSVALGSNNSWVGMGDLRRYEAPAESGASIAILRRYEDQVKAANSSLPQDSEQAANFGNLHRYENSQGYLLSAFTNPGMGDVLLFEANR